MSTMVDNEIGTGEIANQFAKELADQYDCYAACTFRDLHTAISTLYTFFSTKNRNRLLFSPLSDACWMHAMHHSACVGNCAPLITDTVIADYEHAFSNEYDYLCVDNTLGYIPDYASLRAHGRAIIEIIGAGMGGLYNNQHIGTYGDIVVIEMEEDDIITCGCGVALLFRKKETYTSFLATSEAHMHHHAIPDINAALGITQLHRYAQFAATRKSIAKQYSRNIGNAHPSYHSPFSTQHVLQSFPIRYQGNKKDLRKFTQLHKVECRNAFTHSIAAHYPDTVKHKDMSRMIYLQEVLHQTVLFPLYPHLRQEEIHRVARVIANLP